MHANRPHPAGYTLIELMVTVAIIALVAGFTFGELNTSSYRLKSVARTLKANMQKARLLAVKENCPVYVDFDFDGTGVDKKYSIWKDLNWNDPDTTSNSGVYNDATTDNNGDGSIDTLDEELIEAVSLPSEIAFGTVANGDGGPANTPDGGGTLPPDGVWFTGNVDRLRFSPWGTSSNGNAYLHNPNRDSAGSHAIGTNNIGRIRSSYYATNGGSWR